MTRMPRGPRGEKRPADVIGAAVINPEGRLCMCKVAKPLRMLVPVIVQHRVDRFAADHIDRISGRMREAIRPQGPLASVLRRSSRSVGQVLHSHRRDAKLLGDHPNAGTARDSQCLTDALRQLRSQGGPTERQS
jgi:hypothetical protein